MPSVLVFVLLAYALSWLAWLPILLTGGSVTTGVGWPTHLPGLLGPAIAAIWIAWRTGGASWADLRRRVTRLPHGQMAWLATLSPLLIIAAALIAEFAITGRLPPLSALGLYSGLPQLGVVPVLLIVLLVNGLGEEIGWRGFLLPQLQLRFGPTIGTLLVWPIWLGWHLPLFACVADFQAMDFATAAFGWSLGLLAGTLVLAHVAHLAGGSVIAVALWHTLFNLASGGGLSASAAATATICVMLWAVLVGAVALSDRGQVLRVV